MPSPHRHVTVDACVDALIAHIGRDLRVGIPLGLGKPVALINALYARARAEPDLQLTILTALNLPVEGAALLLVVDRPLDMMRTVVNVWSDSCGAAIIARTEGETAVLEAGLERVAGTSGGG